MLVKDFEIVLCPPWTKYFSRIVFEMSSLVVFGQPKAKLFALHIFCVNCHNSTWLVLIANTWHFLISHFGKTRKEKHTRVKGKNDTNKQKNVDEPTKYTFDFDDSHGNLGHTRHVPSHLEYNGFGVSFEIFYAHWDNLSCFFFHLFSKIKFLQKSVQREEKSLRPQTYAFCLHSCESISPP